jgi:5-methylcytosine-specific restriction endonuclease McrA
LYVSPSGQERCRACKREADRRYRIRNHDKILQGQREWHKQNGNSNKEACKRYRNRHPEKYKASKKKYLKNNPEIRRVWEHRKRVIKANQLGDWKAEYEKVLFEVQKGLCFYCDTLLGEYHIEHMVPLSRGGMHDRKNIVLSCPDCNLRKGTRTVEEFMYVRRN